MAEKSEESIEFLTIRNKFVDVCECISESDIAKFADELLEDGLISYTGHQQAIAVASRVSPANKVAHLVAETMNQVNNSPLNFIKFVSILETRNIELASILRTSLDSEKKWATTQSRDRPPPQEATIEEATKDFIAYVKQNRIARPTYVDYVAYQITWYGDKVSAMEERTVLGLIKSMVWVTPPTLEEALRDIRSQIRALVYIIYHVQNEIQQEEQLLKYYETEIAMNSLTYRAGIHKVDLPPGMYATNCLNCNYTCHENCPYNDDEDKYKCQAMDNPGSENATCTVCPEKCSWKWHVNNPYKFEICQEMETRTSDEMKRRHDSAVASKIIVERKIIALEEESKQLNRKVLQCITVAKKSHQKHLAHLTESEIIDMLNKFELKEADPGWGECAETLKGILSLTAADPNDIHYHSSKLEQLMKTKGRISMGVIQCMPFGPPRIGKTCVKDRLAGKMPKGEPARREGDRIVYPGKVSMSTGAADEAMKLFVERSSSSTFQEQDEKWVHYRFDQEVISLVKGVRNLVSISSKSTDTSRTRGSKPAVQEFVKKGQSLMETLTLEEQAALIVTRKRLQQHKVQTMPVQLQDGAKVKVKDINPLQPVTDAFRHENPCEVKAILENSLTIHFTDTGGQPEFQEIIPMLVAGPSLFLLVFSLATRLDHPYEVRYDTDDEEIEPYMSSFTVQSVMLQCLASIACIGTQRKEDDKVKVIKPKVLFIGTQLDLLTNRAELEQINSKLWHAICHQGLQHLVERYSRNNFIFAVDNYDQSDASFDAIRSAISDVAKREEEMYKIELPVPFVLLDFYLRQPKECRLQEETCKKVLQKFNLKKALLEKFLKNVLSNENKNDICDPSILAEACRVLSNDSNEQIPPETELLIQALMELNDLCHQRDHVMTMEEFEAIATKCGITSREELKEALWTLHHLLGTIRHYPDVPELQDTVITHQQLFFNIPTKLITSTFSLRKRRRKLVSDQSCIDKFYDEGFFTMHDLNMLWEKEKAHLTSEQLVALLQHLHILAPFVQENGTHGYFLPCVLKHARQQCSSTHKSIVDPLLVSFACGFKPNGMFSGLLAFFLQYKGKDDGLKFQLRKEQLFRDQASLYVKPFVYLTIKAMPEYICFTLHQQKAVNTTGICSAVKAVIESGVKVVASRLNYNINAQPRFGFECTCDSTKPTHFAEYSISGTHKCSVTGDYCIEPPQYTQWFHEGDSPAEKNSPAHSDMITLQAYSDTQTLAEEPLSVQQSDDMLSEDSTAQKRVMSNPAVSDVKRKLDSVESGASGHSATIENKLLRKPTTAELSNKLTEARHKWIQIGTQLEIPDYCLQSIFQEYSATDLRLRQVFISWKDQNTSPYTWATIIDVLKRPAIDEKRLSQDIEEWVLSLPQSLTN